MKEVFINEDKTLQIKGIRTREGGKLIKRVGSIMKKAQTDDEFRHAFNGLIALTSAQEKIGTSTIITLMPVIVSSFYDEFIALLADLTGMSEDEIEDLEMDKTFEIAAAIVEETDFNKVIGLVKNFKGLPSIIKK